MNPAASPKYRAAVFEFGPIGPLYLIVSLGKYPAAISKLSTLTQLQLSTVVFQWTAALTLSEPSVMFVLGGHTLS